MHLLLRLGFSRASLAFAVLLVFSPPPVAGQTAIDTAEFGARRARLLAMIPDGVAIILGGQEHPYPVRFRQSPDFSISPGSKSQGRCWY